MTWRKLALVSCLVAGCAPARQAPRATLESPEHAVFLEGVPFFANSSDQCGPSSLASVLKYWGQDVTVESLRTEIYKPSLRGTLPMDMLPAVRSRGLVGRVVEGTYADLK